MSAWRLLACVGLALWLVAAQQSHAEVRSGRSLFLEGCGGCHGLDGKSVSDLVPDLKDQVGSFMCLPQGRAYLGRLPNVAFSPSKDAQLAEILNYVVFTVGGASAPAGSKPFTAAEVGRLRRQPLIVADLADQRGRIVEELIARCGASDALRTYKRPSKSIPIAFGVVK